MILYWNTLCLLFVNSAQHFAAVTSVPMQPRGGFPFNIAFPTKEKHHGGSHVSDTLSPQGQSPSQSDA